jgi:hypothetical protein
MLPDSARQLLTGYVDGELSNRQRKLAQRLLAHSSEARSWLQGMQEDVRRLRGLERHKLGPDFTAGVLQALHQRFLHHASPAKVVEYRLPLWAGLATAAVLLLTVGLASFFYFAHPLDADMLEVPLAANAESDLPPSPELAALPVKPAPFVTALPKELDSPTPARPIPDPMPVPAGVVAKAPHEPVPPPSREVPDKKPTPPAYTLPVDRLELFKPTVASVALLPLVNVREIQPNRLVKEFQKDSAFRIELPCRDTTRAFRRVETALRDHGIHLCLERAVLERLSKPRWKANYVIFLENLTPDELAQVLARVGSDDRKAAALKPRDGQFSKMVLNHMSEADRKELADLLHTDMRPLLGSSARPDPTRTTAKGSERLGLGVTYNPERPLPGSPQVRRFLENRKPLRPGALQVLLVLRETPG